jgi:hypothetical protein
MKYRVLKPIGGQDGGHEPGKVVPASIFYSDEVYDRAADLVRLGYIEPLDDDGNVIADPAAEAAIATAQKMVADAKERERLALADAQDKDERLKKALSLLSPEQLAQIEGSVDAGGDDLDGKKLPELRAIALELGLPEFPAVGTRTSDVVDAIRAARGASN